LNSVRTNPGSYIFKTSNSELLSHLKTQESKEEKPDHILWSEKTYGKAYDYFEGLDDKGISIEEINNYFKKKALEITEINYETFTFSINTTTRGNDIDYLIVDILSEALNCSLIKLLLSSNFDFGTVCAFPKDENSDRIVIGFALKNEA
jgi:hypothetical protein